MYLDECRCCTRKATTSGCINCKIYSVKLAISQLQSSINEIKDTENFSIFINKQFAEDLMSTINFKDIDYILSSNIENDIVALLVNNKSIKEM